jgi:hypothetical protein
MSPQWHCPHGDGLNPHFLLKAASASSVALSSFLLLRVSSSSPWKVEFISKHVIYHFCEFGVEGEDFKVSSVRHIQWQSSRTF